MSAFLGRHGNPYARIGSDPNSSVQLALGSAGVPETFVIDGKGVIRYQHVGPIEPVRRSEDPRRAGGGAVRAIALALGARAGRRRSSRQSNMPPSYWAYRQLPDARQEAKAQALMQELRCLVCQGQSIADSDAELAGDMRDLVRRRIAAGEKPERNPRLADRALRRLGQLSPVDRADRLAVVGRAAHPADLRRRDRRGPAEEEAVMSGWFALLLLIGATLAAFWLLRVRGAMLQLAGAALLFGAAGYALQGRPGLPSSPRAAEQRQAPIPLTNLRHAFFGRFTPTEHWLLMSESLAQPGQDAGSCRHPPVGRPRASGRSGAVGRARQCAGRPCRDADAGQRARLSAARPSLRPAIRRRASSTAWRWRGRAIGKAAIALWRQILAEAPADASWRPVVEDAIAALEGPRRQPQAATGS